MKNTKIKIQILLKFKLIIYLIKYNNKFGYVYSDYIVKK